MRRNMILAFIIIALAAISSLVLILRNNAATEVRTFINRGGMLGSDSLVTALEEYYLRVGSFEGVESYLVPSGNPTMHGQGMGGGRGNSQNLMVTDKNGLVLEDSLNTTTGNSVADEELINGIALHDSQNNTVGYLLVEGGSTINQNAASPLLASLNTAAIQAGVFAGIIALVIALIFAWRLIKPINDLTSAAQTLAAGDLSHRVPVKGNDEMAKLAVAFNSMAESLQKSESARRNMTADIAHELRTPLSVQRAQLEALQDGLYPLSVENLQPILDQTGQLAGLVEDLRTLALTDAGELTLKKDTFNLAEFIQKTVDRFQPAATEKLQTLSFQAGTGEDNFIIADPLRLEQILNNLISNALRHTPEKGAVTISLSTRNSAHQIQIQDTGPGIPEESLPLVFERFYRTDDSRARQDGGTGLGLAIARRLVELHNGTLTASNAVQGGAEFTITLPQNLK